MWKIGDRVFGQRQEEAAWYPGTVRHVDGERFYVIFDDGEDALIVRDRLRPLSLDVGDRILARAGDAGDYAPGTIVGKKGNQVRVRFESGTQEWTDLDLTRWQAQPRRSEPAPARPWEIGAHVLVCWHDLYWYPGAVLRVKGDQYHVFFDDGNQVVTTADRLRPLEVGEGDRVWCRWKAGPSYHAGEIAEKRGEVIRVRYDDGDEETTLLRLVRLDRDDWLPDGPAARLQEGDRVLAVWYDLNWYPGVVVSVAGKRVHVLFDDGDQAMVTPERAKPLAFRVGDRVCCRRKGGPIYYPGEIARIKGEVIHVNYDDGEEETTSVRLVRIEREGYREADDDEFE